MLHAAPLMRGVKRTRAIKAEIMVVSLKWIKRVVGVRHAVRRASSNNHMQRSAVCKFQMARTNYGNLDQRAR
jgi:hypothetical protein